MNFIKKFQKFMYGRYGVDDLYKFLFYIYLFLLFLNIFIKSDILTILELIIFIIMFYRVFSKKTYKRYNENQNYLNFKKKILKPFKILKRNYNDRNEYIYKRCKHCKKLLKLPIPDKKGKKSVKCPKCKKTFNMFVLRSEKIEIISKK